MRHNFSVIGRVGASLARPAIRSAARRSRRHVPVVPDSSDVSGDFHGRRGLSNCFFSVIDFSVAFDFPRRQRIPMLRLAVAVKKKNVPACVIIKTFH